MRINPRLDDYRRLVARGLLVQPCRTGGCPRKTIHPLRLCVRCFRRQYGPGRETACIHWDNS